MYTNAFREGLVGTPDYRGAPHNGEPAAGARTPNHGCTPDYGCVVRVDDAGPPHHTGTPNDTAIPDRARHGNHGCISGSGVVNGRGRQGRAGGDITVVQSCPNIQVT